MVPVSPIVQHNPDAFLLYPDLHVKRHTPEASLAAVPFVSVAVHVVTVHVPVVYVAVVPVSRRHAMHTPDAFLLYPGLHVKRHTSEASLVAVPLLSVAVHVVTVHVPVVYVGVVPVSPAGHILTHCLVFGSYR